MAKFYFKVEAGDFNSGTWATYTENWFTRKVIFQRWLWYSTYYPKGNRSRPGQE